MQVATSQTTSPKSLARLCRQLVFVPFLKNRWLTTQLKNELAERITQAEKGHRGEIRLIIENHLPINSAYHQGCNERAITLFGLHQVWDTEQNTGVLIYVNLCERSLEIIADRGIDTHACQEWSSLCQKTLNAFKAGNMKDGLNTLIDDIGRLLNHYFPCDDVYGDELPNQVIHLK